MDVRLSPLMPEDAGASRALVEEQFAGTPYVDRVLEQLDSALQFEDPEYMALLGSPARGRSPIGLVLFGTVAGARRVVKVHALVGCHPAVSRHLLDGVCERSGERMIVAEIPDDAPFRVATESLEASGYVEEGRVPNYVRDGVALRLLIWRPRVS